METGKASLYYLDALVVLAMWRFMCILYIRDFVLRNNFSLTFKIREMILRYSVYNKLRLFLQC